MEIMKQIQKKDEQLAISYLEEASNHQILEATIELLYFYSSKYIEQKNKDILTKINDLITKIEHHPKFNPIYKKEIEKNIIKLNNKEKIDRTIFTKI